MKVFNLYNGELANSTEREGWNVSGAKVGEYIGGELIGAGLYEAQPGNKIWPYHTHHANEEWLLVLRGQPTLRTPEGERQLDEGDLVCFPRGKAGAHQVWNGSNSPIRVLVVIFPMPNPIAAVVTRTAARAKPRVIIQASSFGVSSLAEIVVQGCPSALSSHRSPAPSFAPFRQATCGARD